MKKLIIPLFLLLCTVSHAGSFGTHFKGGKVDAIALPSGCSTWTNENSQTTHVSSINAGQGDNYERWTATAFTVGGTGYDVGSVVLWMDREADGLAGSVRIYSDNSNNPGTDLTSGGDTFVASDIPATDGGEAVTFTFPSYVSLSASTQYWIVLALTSYHLTNHIHVYQENVGSGLLRRSENDGATWLTDDTRRFYYLVRSCAD